MTFLIIALMNYLLSAFNLHQYIEGGDLLNLMVAITTFGVGQVSLPESLRRLTK